MWVSVLCCVFFSEKSVPCIIMTYGVAACVGVTKTAVIEELPKEIDGPRSQRKQEQQGALDQSAVAAVVSLWSWSKREIVVVVTGRLTLRFRPSSLLRHL